MEAALQPVRDLVKEVQRYKEAAQTDEIRSECSLAELYLEEYATYIRDNFEYRRSLMQRTLMSGTLQREVQIPYIYPTLFLHNEPVLKLFLYNIKKRINRQELIDLFKEQNIVDLEVLKTIHKPSQTCFVIQCHNFPTACLIQTRTCSNKLILFKDSEDHLSTVKSKPDQSTFERPIVPVVKKKVHRFKRRKKKKKVDKLIAHDNFMRVITNNAVASNITSRLDANSFFNLYEACYYDSALLNNAIVFDSSAERYLKPDALKNMLLDAKNFRFTKILFNNHAHELQAPVVMKVLKNQYLRNVSKPELARKKTVDTLDLTKTLLTNFMLSKIADMYSTNTLNLGQTIDPCDVALRSMHCKILSVINCSRVRLTCLSAQNYINLTSLTLIKCNMIYANNLRNFMTTHKFLKNLIVRDCYSLDPHVHLAVIIEALLRTDNVIQNFEFSFSQSFDCDDEFINTNYLQPSHAILQLNLSNNNYCNHVVNEIVKCAINVTELNLLGIPLNQPIDCTNLTNLEVLYLDYNQEIDKTLNTLKFTCVRQLIIVNRLDKSKSKLIDLNFIHKLLKHVTKIEVNINNCSVLPLSWDTARYLTHQSEGENITYKFAKC